MKVLFTGVGSIGTRHVSNLSKLCAARGIPLEIDVLRRTPRELPAELKALLRREIRDDADLDDAYDVLFVTDETSTHFENIVRYKARCRDMFIEKPILDSTRYDISRILPVGDAVYYVACPIRFTEYFARLRQAVAGNDVYAARIIFSSYMPNWQKGRDYRKSFRCSVTRGGGVDIDSLHEIDYMTALFGAPKAIHRVAGKYSDLEMEACDIAVYLFEYADKLVEMHLDYFGRVPNRRVELFAKDDVIVVDFNQKTVVRQLAGTTESFGPDNDFYEKEMGYFLDLIADRRRVGNINTVENALRSLRIAKGITE